MGNRTAQLDPAQRCRWNVADVAPREHLHGFPGYHALLIQLLWNRQIRTPEEVHTFLVGAAAPLHPPRLLAGLEQAVQRLLRARDIGESVAIYGDYDVDGITSSVILLQCLRQAGLNPKPFLPRRLIEGYGLNQEAIERLRDEGVSLIVAVDCGITAHAEISRARELGVDVLVIDHHHVPPVLPPAVAIVNPRQPGCPYPFKDLCAAGLAYKLAWALLEEVGAEENAADQWLDLVALATVADVVPLRGENRTLVLRGLGALNPPRRPGLEALIRQAGLGQGQITSRAIAFVLAPRLNAAGRLEDALVSFQLLSADSPTEAAELAATLESTNRERQRLTDEALELARKEILGQVDLPRLLLVASPAYPPGVVGLVAARLVEEFRRPALVAAIDREVARGSARSIGRFDIALALERCADILARHGGHARAAGFTVAPDNLPELQTRLEDLARQEISDEDLQPALEIDAEIRLGRYDASLYQLLDPLEPCGHANPSPLFLARQVEVLSARAIGREPPGHLQLRLRAGSRTWDAIWFGHGARRDQLPRRLDIVFAIEADSWNGSTTTRLRLHDIRPSSD